MKLSLNSKGFVGAWVVKRLIRATRDSSLADSTIPPPPPPAPIETKSERIVNNQTTDTTSAMVNDGMFKIQVIATSDEVKAQQMELELEIQFSKEAFYEKSGNVYKVFIGKFQIREEAEKLLNHVRENGYPDAWLVY